jgi:hypothetical protein
VSQRKYDSTVARIAGNLLSGNAYLFGDASYDQWAVERAVAVARAIVAEVQRTEPPKEPADV